MAEQPPMVKDLNIDDIVFTVPTVGPKCVQCFAQYASNPKQPILFSLDDQMHEIAFPCSAGRDKVAGPYDYLNADLEAGNVCAATRAKLEQYDAKVLKHWQLHKHLIPKPKGKKDEWTDDEVAAMLRKQLAVGEKDGKTYSAKFRGKLQPPMRLLNKVEVPNKNATKVYKLEDGEMVCTTNENGETVPSLVDIHHVKPNNDVKVEATGIFQFITLYAMATSVGSNPNIHQFWTQDRQGRVDHACPVPTKRPRPTGETDQSEEPAAKQTYQPSQANQANQPSQANQASQASQPIQAGASQAGAGQADQPGDTESDEYDDFE